MDPSRVNRPADSHLTEHELDILEKWLREPDGFYAMIASARAALEAQCAIVKAAGWEL
jgi:hypothetical protein